MRLKHRAAAEFHARRDDWRPLAHAQNDRLHGVAVEVFLLQRLDRFEGVLEQEFAEETTGLLVTISDGSLKN